MGSIERKVLGTLMVPVLDGEPQSDPATRAYMAPPKPKKIVQRSFQMVDFRPEVFNTPASGGDFAQEAAFLAKHGFTAVKHESALTSMKDYQDAQAIKDIYYPEIEELAKRVTGCRTVIITNSLVRGAPPPSDLDGTDAFKGGSKHTQDKMKSTPWHSSHPMQPVRLPHCDSTALGGRQSVRAWMKDVYDAAAEAGVHDVENAICAEAGVQPNKAESCALMEEKYNDHAAGELGPRYANYSIWRPIRRVTRDPLAMIPWKNVKSSKDLVIWPYDNRNRGFDGDWTRELAMMKIRPEAAERESGEEEDLKLFYVDNMYPDEVLFVKFFDTAGLGQNASEEIGCVHASPDLGDYADGDARESIECRCMLFW